MNKYYNKDIPDEVHVIYGSRQSGKTYCDLKQFENLKQRIRSYNIKRIDYIIRVLLTDRYDEFVKYIRKGE